MTLILLDLPNEILEILTFYVIGRPWKGDVRDFFSFTCTCRRLRYLTYDERYWQIMAQRRDPSHLSRPTADETWLDYCRRSNSVNIKSIFFIRSIVYSL
jgi:hypothetical protein